MTTSASKFEQARARKSPSTTLKATTSQSDSNTDNDTFSAKILLQKIAGKVGHKRLVSILVSAPLKPICTIKGDSTEILYAQSFNDIWRLVGDSLERCGKERLCQKIYRAFETINENQLVLKEVKSILDCNQCHYPRKGDKLQEEAGNLDTQIKLTNSPNLSEDIRLDYAGISPTCIPPHNRSDASPTLKPQQDCSHTYKPPQDAISNYAGINPTHKPQEDVSSIHNYKSPMDTSQPIQHKPQQDQVNISHTHNPRQDCVNTSPTSKPHNHLRFSTEPQQEGLALLNSSVGAEKSQQPPIESLKDYNQLSGYRSFFARPPTPGSKDIESDSSSD